MAVPLALPEALARTRTPHAMPPQDVLPALDTPREALTLAALLRLPPSMPRARKLRRVEELLEVLELGSCADIRIGDSTSGARGLSGGQRRRVTSESKRTLRGGAAPVGARMGCQWVLLCRPRLQGRRTGTDPLPAASPPPHFSRH